MSLTSRKNGFTLIEITIVLAIAALILAIVFTAVSGAQKSRRDAQRKSDASRLAVALEQYAGNNGGNYPAAVVGTTTPPTGASYWSGTDPSTGVYTFYASPATDSYGPGIIDYSTGYICNNNVATTSGASARNYVVVIGLEQGGSYCISNK